MSEHLLIDPNLLYKIHPSKNIIDYYPFNFLPTYKSIETPIFYDILNSISSKQLSNLNNHLFKQWSLTKRSIDSEETTPIKRKKNLLKRNYTCSLIKSKEELNSKLTKLINKDLIVGLYVMNKLLRFLYPC